VNAKALERSFGPWWISALGVLLGLGCSRATNAESGSAAPTAPRPSPPVSVAASTSPAPTFEGRVLYEESVNAAAPRAVTLTLKGGRSRLDTAGESAYQLYDAATQRFRVVDVGSSTVQEIQASAAAKLHGDEWKAKVERSGGSARVADQTCEPWTVTRNSRSTALCVAAGRHGELLLSRFVGFDALAQTGAGLPLQATVSEAGAVLTVLRAVRVVSEPVPDELFESPAGYRLLAR
jgi:hypothetical protein